jgi:hypothetical protein
MNGSSKSREDLTQQAHQVRSQLLRTVAELNQRRHEALDLRSQLKRHLRAFAIGGGLLLVLTAGSVALVVSRIATATSRRRRNRWRLAKDIWRHPERAMRGERRSFLGQMARSLVISVLSTAVSVSTRRLVARLPIGRDAAVG